MKIGNRRFLFVNDQETQINEFSKQIEIIDQFIDESEKISLSSREIFFYLDLKEDSTLWGREIIGPAAAVKGHDFLDIRDYESIEVQRVGYKLADYSKIEDFVQMLKTEAKSKSCEMIRFGLELNDQRLSVDYYAS